MDIRNNFYSLNGGNQMCLRAFSGILIKNGLEKTISQIDEELLGNRCIQAKNNLHFISRGVKSLDKKTLEPAILLATNCYKKWIENSGHSNGKMELIQLHDNQRKELAAEAKRELDKFGKLCNSKHLEKISFGLISPLAKIKFIHWDELNSDFFNYQNQYDFINDKISELLIYIEHLYCNDMMPDDMDIQQLSEAIATLDNKYKEICNFLHENCANSQEAEPLHSDYQKASSSLFQELVKMPFSAQWGFFCMCNKKFVNEGHFPVIFGLENITHPEL